MGPATGRSEVGIRGWDGTPTCAPEGRDPWRSAGPTASETSGPEAEPTPGGCATSIAAPPVASAVVDLQETPAVPPMDSGGDERLGYFIAGGLLVALGWGLAVGANLLVHATAGSTGASVGWIRITSTLGPIAWAVLALGLVTGAVGAALIGLARRTHPGPFVLPGYGY